MKGGRGFPIACLACALVLLGCRDRADNSVTDGWLGVWKGPEGTFLRIEGGKGSYSITIQNLDGPMTYKGSAAGARIEFERSGVNEVIRATNGAETGMKWLADKSHCLTIRPGEGFCRD